MNALLVHFRKRLSVREADLIGEIYALLQKSRIFLLSPFLYSAILYYTQYVYTVR